MRESIVPVPSSVLDSFLYCYMTLYVSVLLSFFFLCSLCWLLTMEWWIWIEKLYLKELFEINFVVTIIVLCHAF